MTNGQFFSGMGTTGRVELFVQAACPIINSLQSCSNQFRFKSICEIENLEYLGCFCEMKRGGFFVIPDCSWRSVDENGIETFTTTHGITEDITTEMATVENTTHFFTTSLISDNFLETRGGYHGDKE